MSGHEPAGAGKPGTAPGAELRVFTDGASRSNPGHAGIGIVVLDVSGATLDEWREYLGQCTNNVAEYQALLTAIRRLKVFAPSRVIFHLDSELVVRQLNGQYRVKDPKMKQLYDQVRREVTSIPVVIYRHIDRRENARADRLANEAIDLALSGSAARD